VTNLDETAVDCGGSYCGKCDDGASCKVASDCWSNVCTNNLCVMATCSDGVKNNYESDVDCGFGCSFCDTGKSCNYSGDCDSQVCVGHVCQAPTCSDGVANQDEKGADCGGSCPTACTTCSHDLTLTWSAPYSRSDGTCLTDLAGYKLYWGSSSGNYTNQKDLALGSADLTCWNVGPISKCGPAVSCTTTLPNLPNGTYYLAMTSYDSSAQESTYSGEVSKTIDCP